VRCAFEEGEVGMGMEFGIHRSYESLGRIY
jgi:hypothetical protein